MNLDRIRMLRRAGLRVAIATALSASHIALAQQAAPQPAAKDQLEEVIVTAQKYVQPLTDVPMSIAALSGQTLEREGQDSFTEYAPTVPALNFASFSEGQNRINIRGMQGITGAATVAYLVDGVVQSLDTGSPDNELFDVNRVEVLRGPQGTLYGAGAVGGAIKIITNAADPAGFDARVAASYEQNDEHADGYNLQGMINVPLIKDTLALRAVVTERDMDGYITVREPEQDNTIASAIFGVPLKNFSNENIVASDANTVNVKSGRIGLTWYPTSSHDLEITARYGQQKYDVGWAPAVSPSLKSEFGTFNQIQGQNGAAVEDSPLKYKQGNLTVSWQLPSVSIESITGYSELDINNLIPTFLVIPLAPGISLGDMLHTDLSNKHRYISEELRFESATEGPWKWTAGLFYQDTKSDIRAVTSQGPVFEVLDPDNLFGINSTISAVQKSKEYAVYGQAEYAFASKWSALVGARYYYNDYTSEFPDTPVATPTFSQFSPKLGLSYHYTDDVLFYTSVAQGFRPGGVNIPTISPPPNGFEEQYDPDKVWNAEVGVNSRLLDGRMSVNAAIFYAKWQDFQQDVLLTNDLGQQQVITGNAGRAHSAGVEFEVTAMLPLHFIGKIGGAYLNAEIDEDAPNPNLPDGVVPSGTGLENVPDWSGSVSLSQELPISSSLTFTDALLYTYRGQTHADILSADQSVAPAYSMFNVRVGLKDAGNRWEGSLYLNNAFNKVATNFAFQDSDTEFLVPLRTLGVRASYSFK